MTTVKEFKSIANGSNNHAINIVLKYAPNILYFINSHISLSSQKLHLIATSTELNVKCLDPKRLKNIVNLKRLNDTRHANRFLETVNIKLETDGIYIGCFESKEQRKARIFSKYSYISAIFFYYLLDFIWKRVIPKTPFFHHFYYALTKGHNRVFSTPEVLGRLISCGFEICEYKELGRLTYFAARKKSKPEYDKNPTYNAIISLKRIGEGGAYFKFYKFRTMYPYSEYLQNFVYKQNGTKNGDKFKNDFRITSWGNFMRRYWLDELPMLINWVKGDLKLVGVRPLSKQKYETYPLWLKQKRVNFKSGLVPPFYADMPETIDEFFESESIYLEAYASSPFTTDVKYFFKAVYNILFKGARSK